MEIPTIVVAFIVATLALFWLAIIRAAIVNTRRDMRNAYRPLTIGPEAIVGNTYCSNRDCRAYGLVFGTVSFWANCPYCGEMMRMAPTYQPEILAEVKAIKAMLEEGKR